MSADNGIYILKTKDQYRVAHLCAIDNVTWSVIDGDWCTDMDKRGKLVPTRVVEIKLDHPGTIFFFMTPKTIKEYCLNTNI